MGEILTIVQTLANCALRNPVSWAVNPNDPIFSDTVFLLRFMVILGWILDKPLPLLFDPFESIVCSPASCNRSLY